MSAAKKGFRNLLLGAAIAGGAWLGYTFLTGKNVFGDGGTRQLASIELAVTPAFQVDSQMPFSFSVTSRDQNGVPFGSFPIYSSIDGQDNTQTIASVTSPAGSSSFFATFSPGSHSVQVFSGNIRSNSVSIFVAGDPTQSPTTSPTPTFTITPSPTVTFTPFPTVTTTTTPSPTFTTTTTPSPTPTVTVSPSPTIAPSMAHLQVTASTVGGAALSAVVVLTEPNGSTRINPATGGPNFTTPVIFDVVPGASYTIQAQNVSPYMFTFWEDQQSNFSNTRTVIAGAANTTMNLNAKYAVTGSLTINSYISGTTTPLAVPFSGTLGGVAVSGVTPKTYTVIDDQAFSLTVSNPTGYQFASWADGTTTPTRTGFTDVSGGAITFTSFFTPAPTGTAITLDTTNMFQAYWPISSGWQIRCDAPYFVNNPALVGTTVFETVELWTTDGVTKLKGPASGALGTVYQANGIFTIRTGPTTVPPDQPSYLVKAYVRDATKATIISNIITFTINQGQVIGTPLL